MRTSHVNPSRTDAATNPGPGAGVSLFGSAHLPWVTSHDLQELRAALASGDLVAARVHPVVSGVPDEMPAVTILVDTSASRARGGKRDVDRLGARSADRQGPRSGARRRVLARDTTAASVGREQLGERARAQASARARPARCS